ncbi:hypothetical protein A2U01_0029057, partial [Trifolium medium]|nr:hypothetical protein [Trifolium medium]
VEIKTNKKEALDLFFTSGLPPQLNPAANPMDYRDDSSQSEKNDEFLKMLNDLKALRIDTGRDDKERILVEMLKVLFDSVLALKSKVFNPFFTLKDASDACLKLLSKMEPVSEELKNLGVNRETLDLYDRVQASVQLLYDQTVQQQEV